MLDSQFAFRKGHAIGTKDQLAVEFLKWIQALNERKKVGLYLSDVSGAFDHVEMKKLLNKLEARGVRGVAWRLFRSYLTNRRMVVVVGGFSSISLAIANYVFQGGVFGPILWNIFFQDIQIPIVISFCEDFQFADDVTVSRVFPIKFGAVGSDNGSNSILSELKMCQDNCHKWAAENQIVFDKSKEFFMILASSSEQSYGVPFRNLGVFMDPQLSMKEYLTKVANACRWQISILYRCRSFFNTLTLVQLYKAYVWPIMEYGTSAYFHCCDSTLAMLDDIQHKFLRMLDISESIAFLEYNIAPLKLRRKWAMFALLFKIAKGTAPRLLSDLFPKMNLSNRSGCSTRSNSGRHSLCLEDPRGKLHHLKDLDIFTRSLFGLVHEFNALDRSLVDTSPSIKSFQKKLQDVEKEKVRLLVAKERRLNSL